MDDRGVGPGRRVGPAQAGDPGRLAGERPLHRLDLAGRGSSRRCRSATGRRRRRRRAGARCAGSGRSAWRRCSANHCVSANRYPVSRSTTSASGIARLTRCTSTASPKLAVTTRPSPNSSPAQRRISAAVLASRSGSTPTMVAAAVVSDTDRFNHESRQIRSGIGQIRRPGRLRLPDRRWTALRLPGAARPPRGRRARRRRRTDRRPQGRRARTPRVPTCASWPRDVSPAMEAHLDAGRARLVPSGRSTGRPRRRPPRRHGDGVPDVDDAVAARRHRPRRLGQRRRPARRRARSSCPPSPATGRSPSPWAPTAPARRSPAACATWPGGCSTTTWWRWPPASPPNGLRCAPGRIDRGRRLERRDRRRRAAALRARCRRRPARYAPLG